MRAGGKATSEVLRPIADHGTHTTDQYRSFGHGQRTRAAAPERASPSTHSSGRSCLAHAPSTATVAEARWKKRLQFAVAQKTGR